MANKYLALLAIVLIGVAAYLIYTHWDNEIVRWVTAIVSVVALVGGIGYALSKKRKTKKSDLINMKHLMNQYNPRFMKRMRESMDRLMKRIRGRGVFNDAKNWLDKKSQVLSEVAEEVLMNIEEIFSPLSEAIDNLLLEDSIAPVALLSVAAAKESVSMPKEFHMIEDPDFVYAINQERKKFQSAFLRKEPSFKSDPTPPEMLVSEKVSMILGESSISDIKELMTELDNISIKEKNVYDKNLIQNWSLVTRMPFNFFNLSSIIRNHLMTNPQWTNSKLANYIIQQVISKIGQANVVSDSTTPLSQPITFAKVVDTVFTDKGKIFNELTRTKDNRNALIHLLFINQYDMYLNIFNCSANVISVLVNTYYVEQGIESEFKPSEFDMLSIRGHIELITKTLALAEMIDKHTVNQYDRRLYETLIKSITNPNLNPLQEIAYNQISMKTKMLLSYYCKLVKSITEMNKAFKSLSNKVYCEKYDERIEPWVKEALPTVLMINGADKINQLIQDPSVVNYYKAYMGDISTNEQSKKIINYIAPQVINQVSDKISDTKLPFLKDIQSRKVAADDRPKLPFLSEIKEDNTIEIEIPSQPNKRIFIDPTALKATKLKSVNTVTKLNTPKQMSIAEMAALEAKKRQVTNIDEIIIANKQPPNSNLNAMQQRLKRRAEAQSNDDDDDDDDANVVQPISNTQSMRPDNDTESQSEVTRTFGSSSTKIDNRTQPKLFLQSVKLRPVKRDDTQKANPTSQSGSMSQSVSTNNQDVFDRLTEEDSRTKDDSQTQSEADEWK